MAKVKNVSADVLSLFSVDAPPCKPGDAVTVSDARFVDRAWPKSTWEVVEAPDGYEDRGPDDAYVFVLPERTAEPSDELPELPEGAYAPDAEPLPKSTPPKRGKSS